LHRSYTLLVTPVQFSVVVVATVSVAAVSIVIIFIAAIAVAAIPITDVLAIALVIPTHKALTKSL